MLSVSAGVLPKPIIESAENTSASSCPARAVYQKVHPKIQAPAQKPILGGARTPRQFRTLQIRAIVTHRTRSVGSKDQAIRAEADRGLGHRVRVYYAKKEKK